MAQCIQKTSKNFPLSTIPNYKEKFNNKYKIIRQVNSNKTNNKNMQVLNNVVSINQLSVRVCTVLKAILMLVLSNSQCLENIRGSCIVNYKSINIKSMQHLYIEINK